jgi:hypothetical protein
LKRNITAAMGDFACVNGLPNLAEGSVSGVAAPGNRI